MRTLKLVIAYDGTGFVGWQRQPDGVAVQALIEEALTPLVNGPLVSPFSHRYVWHVPVRLDVERMSDAARRIEGTHDFACFQSSGGGTASSVRTMFGSEVTIET